ncbi:MAG TPA: hypothetical protein VHO72_13640 [Bacteroidales bacterium]|nr:hypothetical protein [Bacteroidales bacterium]
MENQMQHESIDSGIYSNMELTPQAIASLNETRKWTMFFSILGFIFVGFFVLGMIASLFMTSLIPVPGAQVGPIMVLPFLIIIAIYFFPIYYLFQFSALSKKAIATKNPTDLEQAMGYLRNYYRFIGILTIIILSLCVIIFLFAGLATAFFS